MSYLIDNGHKIKQPDAPFAVQRLNISKVCHNGVNCPTKSNGHSKKQNSRL